jgi:hypothetical protein
MVTWFALTDGIVVDLYTNSMLVSKCTCLPVETLVTQPNSYKQTKKSYIKVEKEEWMEK